MRHQKLFQFQITHDYFQSGNKTPFSFSPTEACTGLMRKYRLDYRATEDGFFLYGPVAKDGEDILNYPIREKLKLSFGIYSRDAALTNYSGFPLGLPRKSICLLNNLNTAKRKNGDLFMLPSGGKPKFQEKNNWLVLKPKVFPVEIPPGMMADAIQIFPAGKAGSVISAILNPGDVVFQVDLGNQPDGEYEVRLAGKTFLEVYADDSLAGAVQYPVVIINFEVGDRVPEQGRFIGPQSDKILFKKFMVDIPSRSTIWRYYVIRKYSDIYDGKMLQIESSRKEYTFRTGKQVSLLEREKATLFRSKKPIPLRQTGVKGIELVLEEKENGNRTMVQNLPNPNKNSIIVKEGQAFSDIYVYI